MLHNRINFRQRQVQGLPVPAFLQGMWSLKEKEREQKTRPVLRRSKSNQSHPKSNRLSGNGDDKQLEVFSASVSHSLLTCSGNSKCTKKSDSDETRQSAAGHKVLLFFSENTQGHEKHSTGASRRGDQTTFWVHLEHWSLTVVTFTVVC